MRSEKIRPGMFHSGYDDVVCNVGLRRCESHTTREIETSPDLQGGRLLIYFPHCNLSDGAAESVSSGFFDGDNTPPWETWVSYFRDSIDRTDGRDQYLLAYVPAALLSVADDGIEYNPEKCIQWLSDADVELRDRRSLAF